MMLQDRRVGHHRDDGIDEQLRRVHVATVRRAAELLGETGSGLG
jgi:hypothetical protein